MQQGRLVAATAEEELEGCVFALGGWQRAAGYIWPTEDPINGARKLRSALDPRRNEKLSESERERLIVGAAGQGYYGPAERICRLCGLKAPEPEPPEDAQAALAAELREALAQRERSDAIIERAVEALERSGRPMRAVK